MPTYVSLLRLTTEGAKDIKGSPGRFAEFRKNLEQAGGRLIGAYATMGRYDYVIISEGPDDATAALVTLKALQKGTVRTETMRALTMDEFSQIVNRL